MKTWFGILVLIVTLVGCEGTAPGDPEPAVKKITINASVKGGTGGVIEPSGTIQIDLGSSKSFSLKPYENYLIQNVKINGVEQIISGNIVELKNVFSEKIIEVEFIHKDKLNIQSDYWNLKGLKQYLNGVLVVDAILSEEQLTDKYYFYSDGVTRVYHLNGVSCGGPFDWTYFENPKSIKINQTVFSITEITATSFSYRTSQVTPLGQTLESVHEYGRNPKN